MNKLFLEVFFGGELVIDRPEEFNLDTCAAHQKVTCIQLRP